MRNAKIVAGIRDFIAHHSATGQRPKEEQDTMDAVLIASTFAVTEEDSIKALVRTLGIRPDSLSNADVRAKKLIAEKQRYSQKERKKRSDSWREAARACILEWCHSDAQRLGLHHLRTLTAAAADDGSSTMPPTVLATSFIEDDDDLNPDIDTDVEDEEEHGE
jgi:hypothetical protein